MSSAAMPAKLRAETGLPIGVLAASLADDARIAGCAALSGDFTLN